MKQGLMRSRGIAIFMLLGLIGSGSATYAVTDYMFYSINGDTTKSAMIQGDTVAWGANCDVGASLSWEIWYDFDGDGVIDYVGDVQLVTFVGTDGDTSPESEGPPDISPTPDGWYITPPLILGVAPGRYIFKATNLTDSSSVQKPLICTEMISPPNSFSGWVVVPGHPAPDPVILRNRWIQAEGGDAKNQIWTAMSNDSGRFVINIGSIGTGLPFRVSTPDIPGFVSPDPQMLVASGHTENVIFEYAQAADSVWGFLKDENGTVITKPVLIVCCPLYGSNSKETQTQNGRYVFLFGASELGEWELGCNWSNLIPEYMEPGRYRIDNSSSHGIRHDFVCPTTDTLLYARVTENGGLPTHRYGVYALNDASGVQTKAATDIGASNVAALHITSLYTTGWGASVDLWSDQYPFPPGYTLETHWNPIYHPGDTVHINISRGCMISDTIKSDPADPPVAWNSVLVYLSGWQYFETVPDSNGVFTFNVPAGRYMLGAYAPGRFVEPMGHEFGWIDHDTVGGLGFEINYAHCRVHGSLTTVPLPLTSQVWVYAHSDSTHYSYFSFAEVDTLTGAFEMYLCDGDWTIVPPDVPDRVAPATVNMTVGNAPDTNRTVDLDYGVLDVGGSNSGSLPTVFAVHQNYPNPFNPATTIEYTVPSRTQVTIDIFNVLGERVRTLVNETKSVGSYRIEWNGNDDSGKPASTGVYLYRFRAGEYVETRKMLLLK